MLTHDCGVALSDLWIRSFRAMFVPTIPSDFDLRNDPCTGACRTNGFMRALPLRARNPKGLAHLLPLSRIPSGGRRRPLNRSWMGQCGCPHPPIGRVSRREWHMCRPHHSDGDQRFWPEVQDLSLPSLGLPLAEFRERQLEHSRSRSKMDVIEPAGSSKSGDRRGLRP